MDAKNRWNRHVPRWCRHDNCTVQCPIVRKEENGNGRYPNVCLCQTRALLAGLRVAKWHRWGYQLKQLFNLIFLNIHLDWKQPREWCPVNIGPVWELYLKRILFEIIWSEFAFEDLNIPLHQAQTRFPLTLTTSSGDNTHFWAGSDRILCFT